jgi:hypothetical protein
MKTLWTLLLLGMFFALQAQPNTRIDLTELESPPNASLIYFITTEGDTAKYTNDVASIDSSGRVFTVIIGGDTLKFQDQTGGGFSGVYTDLDFTGTTGLSDGIDDVDDSDADASNEGSLTVGAGTATTSVISSNTAGSTDVTIEAGTNITLTETGNTIEIAASGGGAGWLKDSIQAGNVTIDGLDNDLRFDNINRLALGGDTTEIGAFFSHLVYPNFLTAEWQATTNYLDAGRTWQFRPKFGTYPYFGINAGSDQISINTALVDSNALLLLGLTNDVPSANGYIGHSSADSTISIYYSGAWHELAWRDDIPNITASNGLTKTGNDIELGGTLTSNTTITGAARVFTFDVLDFDVDAFSVNLNTNELNVGTGFSYINMPDAVNRIQGSQNLSVRATDRVELRMSNIGTPSVVLDSALTRTTINGAFRVDGVGYFKPQAINNATDPSEFGFIGYSITDTTLFIWDGGAWKEIGSGSGGGGTSGAFTTTANLTSNAPGSYAHDSFLFGAPSFTDAGTATHDKRYGYNKTKAASIGGEWTGAQADPDSLGSNSVNYSRNSVTLGYASAAVGGQENRMTASGATAVGCNECTGEGQYSAHFGKDAKSSLNGDVVHGGGGDAGAGHHQYRRIVAWNDYSGTGTATMFLNGTTERLVMPINTLWVGKINCGAVVKTAGTGTSIGDTKYYEGRFSAKNIGGTVTVLFLNETSALLDDGGFDGSSSALSLSADLVNDALSVLITNIPGSGTSVTSCTCTLDITESGY